MLCDLVKISSQFINFFNNYEKGFNSKKLEALLKKEIKAAGKVVNPEVIAEKIETTIKSIEAIRRLEFADYLISTYIDKETASEAMPLLVYLYALPLESLASVIKSLQTADISQYANLAALDKEANKKGLFLKIVSKIAPS